MKKLITAVLLLLSVHSFSQTSYDVYKTQLFKSTDGDSKWRPVDDPSMVDFKITLQGDHMMIDAKSFTSFTLNSNTSEDIKGDTYVGKRYRAVEHVRNRSCYVSFLNYFDTQFFTVQVSYLNEDPQYLLVYYILKKVNS
jgi:hypothetical protein